MHSREVARGNQTQSEAILADKLWLVGSRFGIGLHPNVYVMDSWLVSSCHKFVEVRLPRQLISLSILVANSVGINS